MTTTSAMATLSLSLGRNSSSFKFLLRIPTPRPAAATAAFFLRSFSSMNCRPRKGTSVLGSFSRSSSLSPPPTFRESRIEEGEEEREGGEGPIDGDVTLDEWQLWGTTSPLPGVVTDAIEYLKALERETDSQMSFAGKWGKLVGDFRSQEDKKHRATYQGLTDSESKFQFFSARQVACRLLGSRGHLCQKCWLANKDCMCSKITPLPLWKGIKLWVYMHPKDFLRQNNTGKLLWQIFGVQSAVLCLFGISDHEDIMWDEFRNSGKDKVFCLYPNKNTAPKSVQDCFSQDSSSTVDCLSDVANANHCLHFVLIDGTWNNSAAMFRRLEDRAKLVWGEDGISCISLSAGTSVMHKLRPQPSWDRTCTAAAAASLLFELHHLPKFSSLGLDKQGEILEDSLEILYVALTARRIRTGRSIVRTVKGSSNIF